MRNWWGKFVCGVVLGGACGLVCGYVVARSNSEDTVVSRYATNTFSDSDTAFEPATPRQSSDEPVFFADPPANDTIANAVLESTDEVDEVDDAPREPATLPPPDDAVPLIASNPETLRSLLEQELHDLSPTDRDIWLDVLEGLPAEDAVGIVRLWKRFGGGPHAFTDPGLSGEVSTVPLRILEPTPPESPEPDWQTVQLPEAASGLEAARRIVLNNLLHANTFGYRRVEPLFAEPRIAQEFHSTLSEPGCNVGSPSECPPGAASGEVTAAPADRSPGVALVGTRVDQTPGEHIATAHPLDLAIDGRGYFAVESEGTLYFTRLGRFSRDADGRLVLETLCGRLPLHPEVVIPADAAVVEFSTNGDVQVQSAADSPAQNIGAIRLATFASPAQLRPVGDGLFAATDESGTPQFGVPGDGIRGEIVIGQLEQSNVNEDAETALLRRIENWLRSEASDATVY